MRHSLATRALSMLLSATLCSVTGCGHQSASAADASAAQEPTAFSVYDLGSTWRDQTGAPRLLASLRGKPRLVAMIYTKCTSTCPLSIVELKRIEAATDARLGIVLVTLDPAHDSPAQLQDYAREHGMAPERWTLLSGTDEDVRDLAATLGVRYRRLSPADFAHSNTLTLVDADGHIVRQQAGLADDAMLSAVKSLAR